MFKLKPLLICILLPSYAVAMHADVVELEKVDANAASINADGVNQSYTIIGSYTPLALPMTIREIPQSISAITEQQIKDQNIHTIDRALTQATGVSQRVWGSKRSGYNHLFARGSQITNLQVDGLPINEAERDLGNLAASAYERVEVVRGVSGLLDGSGEPGATVNLVRKRPKKSFETELSVGVNSLGRYQAGIDTSTALNADKTWRGRIVISSEGGNTWRRREKDQAISLYGITEYDMSPKTRLTAGFQLRYAKETASASHTFSVYDVQGYATHFGVKDNPAPNWAYSKNRQVNLFASLEHKFNHNWVVKAEYNYVRTRWYHPYGVAGVLTINHHNPGSDLITGLWVSEPSAHTLSASLRGRYKLFNQEHDLIVGVNGYRSDNEGAMGARSFAMINDIYAFSHHGQFPQPTKYMQSWSAAARQKQYGLYAATRIYPTDDLAIILGARYGKRSQSSYSRNKKTMIQTQNTRVTPYIGLVYDFTQNISAYASYSSLFVPQSQKDVNGIQLAPIVGSNLELGLKAELFGGVNASIALFQTNKKNLAVAAGVDGMGDTYYRATNKSKTRGWELDFAGAITSNWHMQFGYAYTDTIDQDGHRLQTETTPKHMFKLFTSYDVPDSGWTVGGGLRWQSKTYSTVVLGMVANTPEARARALANSQQKAFALLDLMARYRFSKNADLTLNIENALNKKYRTQPDRMSFGMPRTINATFSYRFN